MNSDPNIATSAGIRVRLGTFAIIAASSILFCSKGVVVKLAYAHGVDALTVLTLRMAFALPFFLASIWIGSRGAQRIAAADWARMVGLGFLGYYVSALVNFTGLQYVSVGLERIVLYTYPSMVLAVSAFVMRKRVSPPTWAACGMAWLGIIVAYAGESGAPSASQHTTFGTMLVLMSAFTYAIFILLSEGVLRRIGSIRFGGLAGGISCVFMLAHAAAARPFDSILNLPPAVYGHGLILALFGTVAPTLLLSLGLRRTTPQRFAIIGSVGPVTTLLLAWAVLGERPNTALIIGFVLTLMGGLAVSLMKNDPRAISNPPPNEASSTASGMPVR